jgi:hypothetical protein
MQPVADLASKKVRCSEQVPERSVQNVLFVGAERGDEFAHAARLICQGHNVIAINPRETSAAMAFRWAGGRFIRARIEDLPPKSCRLDLICENYPYPSGGHYVPPRPFALARLSRLAPRGRWVLFTEATRFANLLKAAVEYDPTLQQRFGVALTSLSPGEAPPSAYPPVSTRFKLIFKRLR